MTTPYLELLAADRGRELRREAAAARLAALARCCRPTAWGGAARRVSEAAIALRGSLRRRGTAPAPCCA